MTKIKTPRRDRDDIYWIFASINNTKCTLFHTEPYLPSTKAQLPSKLIYASSKPYGKDTVIHDNNSISTKYRVAYKYHNNDIQHVSDREIQDAAYALGLKKSSNIHSNLSDVDISSIEKIIPSIGFLERFPNDEGYLVSKFIAEEYKVASEQIRLTGGAQINKKPLEEQHDLDIIVPISSYEHAGDVWNRIKKKTEGHVVERGFTSPMRWYAENSSMICPFFIYDKKMNMPIVDMTIGEIINIQVEVTDSRLSIFNMPTFKVSGDVDFVTFRSRIARATIVEKTILSISAPLIYITKGEWKGKKGILITDPFKQVTNLTEALSKWDA